MQKKLDIILPAHNEYGNIIPIYQEINKALKDTSYDYSFLFVDDGSTDNTLTQIKTLAASDRRVKYIELSRNFGHQIPRQTHRGYFGYDGGGKHPLFPRKSAQDCREN